MMCLKAGMTDNRSDTCTCIFNWKKGVKANRQKIHNLASGIESSKKFSYNLLQNKESFTKVLLSGIGVGAMMLGKLPVPGRPTNLDHSMARAYCACSSCGWGWLDIFSLLSFLSSFSLFLGDGPLYTQAMPYF